MHVIMKIFWTINETNSLPGLWVMMSHEGIVVATDVLS